jgi:hypothetical protein
VRRSTLLVDAPAGPVLALLADPRRRPGWQRRLRRVVLLDAGPPHPGQRWLDVTVVGIRPRMRTTELAGDRWSEAGAWRGVNAALAVRARPTGAATVLDIELSLHADGLLGRLVRSLEPLAMVAVRSDLRRAGTLLAGPQ